VSVPRSAKRSKAWYGHGLPYLKIGSLPGHLIVVEGTDGVGRSTQIELLRPWLELQGHAVSNTGWTRSPLLSDTINEAKAGHELTVLTFSLLYAADFADRLEHQIIPALRAGFIVIADRYMYTAFARNMVMGADPAWTRELFGFALVPDLVLYLEIDVETLVPPRARGKRHGLLGVRDAPRARQRHLRFFRALPAPIDRGVQRPRPRVRLRDGRRTESRRRHPGAPQGGDRALPRLGERASAAGAAAGAGPDVGTRQRAGQTGAVRWPRRPRPLEPSA
jgi:thymidylate kinase